MNEFIKASLIRAVRTIAQTAVACIGTATVLSSVDWKVVLSASLLSGILSVLTSIATGLPEVEYEKYPELRQHKDELQSNYIGDRFYTAHDAPEEDEDEREDI
jgi:hypothetical protein